MSHIIAIDGPAGVGKSTVARLLAERLGYSLLDTGAMFRAATLAVMQLAPDFDDVERMLAIVRGATIEYRPETGRVLLDGADVTSLIRSPEVTRNIHHLANNARIRPVLAELQRRFADGRDIVVEGRDMGTVVFPDATIKVFLTAAPEIRARRRALELAAAGRPADEAEVLAEMRVRDQRDAERDVAPLIAAPDAHTLDTGAEPAEAIAGRIAALLDSAPDA